METCNEDWYKTEHTNYMNTLLFGDKQIIKQANEGNLQKTTYELYKICKKCNMIISIAKSKVMAFRVEKPVQ